MPSKFSTFLKSRKLTNFVHYILDNIFPPILRDSTLLMRPVFRLLLGPKYKLFFEFKSRLIRYDQQKLNEYYNEINRACLQRPTDLNQACIDRILKDISGTVLEVGCGKGYLAEQVAKTHTVVAVDVDIDANMPSSNNPKYMKGDICHLAFADKQFKTTICTHTLEHVLSFEKAISELRRVTKNKLIIVVPMQRYYRYTFDTHIHFFPDFESFLMRVSPTRPYVLERLNGDIYYCETIE